MTLRTSNGYPFTVLAALPTVRTGIRVEIYDRDDPATLLDVLPDSRNRKWVDPLDDVGAGEFEIHEHDPKLVANPDLLRSGNYVRFYLDNIARFTFRIEGRKWVPAGDNEDGDRWVHVSGRGALATLEDGAIYPEGGFAGEADRDVTGLTPGEAFILFKDEADARGSIVSVLDVDFTATLDSANQPYNFTLDEVVRAGRDDLLSILKRWAEMGVDVRATPAGAIQLFANGYGVDRSIQTGDTAPVIFRRAHNIKSLDIDEDLIIKNTLLIETPAGFFERSHPTSATEHLRREGYLSLGNTTSGDYIDRATDAAFAKLANVRTAITAEILDVEGHRPYVDAGPGDWVLATNHLGALEAYRIRGMTVSEDDAGNPIFVPTLNEEAAELEDRLQRWLRTMTPGTLGGTETETTAPNTSTPAEVVDAVDDGIDDHVASHPHFDELGDLTDVDLTGVEEFDLLQIVGGEWVPLDFKVDLSTPPTNTQVLHYNLGTGRWEPTDQSGGGGGASNVSLVGVALTSSVNTGDTTVAVTIPETEEDDLIVLIALFRNSFQVQPGGPDEADWDLYDIVGVESSSPTSPTSNDNVAIWTKRATGAQTSVDFNVDDDGTDAQRWVAVVLRGALGVDDWAWWQYPSLDPARIPSVQGTNGGILIGIWSSIFDSGTFDDPPADMTEQVNGDSGFSDTRIMAATKVLTETGHTGPKIATHTAINQYVANLALTIR